jgi:DNA polymerase-3 subunit chi
MAADAGAQVDFYVTPSAEPDARLRLACRITEKAYLAGHRVLVWCPVAADRDRFDDLLWTFGDRSFVPHDVVDDAARHGEAPVTVTGGGTPAEDPDVLVNLDAAVPAFAARARRIVECVDGDEARRASGRQRFRAYRDLGLAPGTHQVAEGSSL